MTKRKKISLIVLFFVLLFAGEYDVNGCSCLMDTNSPPCGSYWNSDAVFIGLAEKVSIENQEMKVSFSVEKSIRGDKQKKIEIFTSANGGMCGYPFEEGERYFVYSQRDHDGKLTVHLCGRTTLLKDAEPSLKFAKEVETEGRTTRLYGNVYLLKQESYKDGRSNIPLVNIEITASSFVDPRKFFKTKTDQKGFYIFKGIPPGLYQLKAEFQNGMREMGRKDLPGHYMRFTENGLPCYNEIFFGTSQGFIRGRITGYTHFNLQQQISLLPIDENGKAVIESIPFQETWARSDNGEFLFESVPAGKYFISINPNSCPAQYPKNYEFAKMFLPGVVDESQAKIVTVNDYQQTVTEDFQLLPPLKERWFSGVVLSSDKTPLSGAEVSLMFRNTKECFLSYSLNKVTTDANGHFRIKGYDSYNYQVIAAYMKNKNQGRSAPKLFSKVFEIPLKGNVENFELVVDSSY